MSASTYSATLQNHLISAYKMSQINFTYSSTDLFASAIKPKMLLTFHFELFAQVPTQPGIYTGLGDSLVCAQFRIGWRSIISE